MNTLAWLGLHSWLAVVKGFVWLQQLACWRAIEKQVRKERVCSTSCGHSKLVGRWEINMRFYTECFVSIIWGWGFHSFLAFVGLNILGLPTAVIVHLPTPEEAENGFTMRILWTHSLGRKRFLATFGL
jgi:hypothetical protein